MKKLNISLYRLGDRLDWIMLPKRDWDAIERILSKKRKITKKHIIPDNLSSNKIIQQMGG